jgi:fatty acid desaturase
VISFDVQKFLRDSPSWFRKLVLALEWMYFPAVEFIMRAFVIGMPFVSRQPGRARLRMLAILAVRTSAFTALGWYSPWALALYFLAYLIFITVLRFADCFQHTYDAYPIIDDTPVPQDKVRDRIYEQQNTYTNVVGLKSPILNMLWLNFGFHNAHHHKPAMPWHRLPALHRECYDDRFTQVLPARELLRSFHINRVRRVLSADYGRVLGPDEKGRADGFVGAVGVSFLTAA